MSELNDLYQDLIIDHSKSPRNYRAMENPTKQIEGYNPLCGDQITLFLKMKDGRIEDITFQGSGCAISKSSASLMTESLKSKTPEEAERLFRTFQHLIKGEPVSESDEEQLGKLAAFSGVSQFPTRVKCAALAWHSLHSGLREKSSSGPVTTE